MAAGDDTARQMLPLSPVIKKEELGSPFSPPAGSPGDRAFPSPAMSPSTSTTPIHPDAHMDFTTTTSTSTDTSVTFHAGGVTPGATTSASPKTELFLNSFTSPLEGGNGGQIGGPPTTPTTPVTPVTPGPPATAGSHHPSPHPPPTTHHHHNGHHQRRKSGYESSTSPDSPDRHFCSSTTQSNGDLNLSSRADVSFQFLPMGRFAHHHISVAFLRLLSGIVRL